MRKVKWVVVAVPMLLCLGGLWIGAIAEEVGSRLSCWASE